MLDKFREHNTRKQRYAEQLEKQQAKRSKRAAQKGMVATKTSKQRKPKPVAPA